VGTGVSPGLRTVLDFFAGDDWLVHYEPGDDHVTAAVRGASGEWWCRVWWVGAGEQLLVYSVCPVPIPEPGRPAVSAYVLRANSAMTVGNLELDLDDGELRVRTSLAVPVGALTVELVRRAVYGNVHTMDHHLPAIVRIVSAAVPR
jgi:hypothetical protein